MVRVVQSKIQLVAKHAMLSMCVACNETSIARTKHESLGYIDETLRLLFKGES
jgi:hypothetical protein